MANEDDNKVPPIPPAQRQQIASWLDGPYWDTPPLRRNNLLYDNQPAMPPHEPPSGTPPVDVQGAEIAARF